jgi:Ig domain of plant-specific actin-binding protein
MSLTSPPTEPAAASLRRWAALASALAACVLCLAMATNAYAWLPPTNISPPTITGTAQQGQTLTEHHGEWNNIPTAYSYQWLRCNSSGTSCGAIGGATNQTYAPVAEDVGHKLRVDETASNFGGSSTPSESAATSVVVPPVPVDTTLPTVTGTAQQAQTLSEHHGEWSNSPTGYSYQWLRCSSIGSSCTPIGGATGSTYSPVAEDVGHELRVTETAGNGGGSGSAVESAPTAVVLAGPSPVADPPADPAADPPADPAAAKPVVVLISVTDVRVDKQGNAQIPLSCPASATGGCKGTLVITFSERRSHRKRAVESLLCARGCRQLGKAHYEARAGQKVKVRVHIASVARRVLAKGKDMTATLTATSVNEGTTTTVAHKLVLEPPRVG